MTIEIQQQVPKADEFCVLRIKAGLSEKSIQAAEIGLPNSLYGVSIRDDGQLIAMGRVVGDGACNFEIVDVAVDPDYQGKGVGRKVMEYIDRYLAKNTLLGSYVSLIADEPGFYEKLGYRLVAPKCHGMSKKFVVQS